MTTTITTEGNLTADPELRITRSKGMSVCTLRLAVSDRRKNLDGEYADTQPVFYEATVWGASAEHVADSVSKGDRLLISGTTWDEEWTDRDGNPHIKHALNVDMVGVSMRFATAKPNRAPRSQSEPADNAAADAVSG